VNFRVEGRKTVKMTGETGRGLRPLPLVEECEPPAGAARLLPRGRSPVAIWTMLRCRTPGEFAPIDHRGGGEVIVSRDKSHLHDPSRRVRPSLAGHSDDRAERLAARGPETSPDEDSRQHSEAARLANLIPDDTAGSRRVLIEKFDLLHGRPDPLATFIEHARPPVKIQNLSS